MRFTSKRLLAIQFILWCLAAHVSFPKALISEDVSAADAVAVGAVLPLSGDYAQYGKELQRGLLLAESELAESSSKVKVHIEDGGTMLARSSLNAATKLVHINGAKVILVLGADDVGPLLGLAKSSHFPILSLWDSSKSLFDMGEHVFSNGFSVEATGPKIAKLFSKKLQLSRIAIIGNSTTWSTSITKTFGNEINKLGGKIVFSESVADDWLDFRTIILRLKKTDAQAIFLPLSLPSGVVACIRQLRELGVSLPIATGEALVGDATKQLGPSAEGVYVGWPAAAVSAPLEAAYVKRFGESPWNPSIYKVGYDGLYAIAGAIKKSTGENMMLALSKYYGPSRSANREYEIFQVTKGKLLMVD